MLYDYTIFPLECVYKVVYLGWYELLQSYGAALIALSFTAHIVLAPLIEWGKRFQVEENRLQEILQPQIVAIKENFHGAAAHKELAWLYKRYGYHPAMAVRSAMMVLVQLPFLMAAYYMLSALPDIEEISFGAIVDLSEPDGLLGGVNLLPIAMTLLNFGATFGQQNFSRRDRVQAVVIALLFLLLLYDAPSALLVYWTGNNFWMFAESVGQKSRLFVKITAELGAGQAKLWSIAKKNCVPLALSLTLCLFVPLDFYLSNADEIWFTAPEILPYLLTATLVLWLLLSLPIKFLPPRGKIFYGAVLLGLTIGVFGQSYLLNPDYGQFNGIEIDWDKYRQADMIDALIWLAIIMYPVHYARKYSNYVHHLRGIFFYGSTIIVLTQFIALCYVGATQTIDKHYRNTLTTQNMLTVSEHDNIVVLLLDMFDTRFFQVMQRENPELIDQLDGFTYYPDALSVFGYTDYSLPQMLTGAIYDNTRKYSDYIDAAWHNNKFYDLLQAHNYDIALFTGGEYVADDAPVTNLLTVKDNDIMRINEYTLTALGKAVLFRSLPNAVKKHFVIYSTDLWQQQQGELEPFSEDNLFFYHRLQHGLTFQKQTNSFRWYHLRGAHMPYNMTRDLERVESGASTAQNQAVGSFKIALDYLRQLKEAGIYDRATIVILADHGKHSENERENFDQFKPVPLLLVKQPQEQGKLKVSPNAVSFVQLTAALAHRFPEVQGEFGRDFAQVSLAERLFYRISVTGDHQITEYSVGPSAVDNVAWKRVKTLPYHPRSADTIYRMGTELDFRAGKNGENYFVFGWSHPLDWGTLTEGNKAEIKLSPKNLKPGRDLILRLTAQAYLTETIREQRVEVAVNGQPLCVWVMKDVNSVEYKALIPQTMLNDKDICLSFTIATPAKTWIFGDGYHHPGFGLQKLTLTYAK